MDLVTKRLTQEAFAPYGDVIAVPVRPNASPTA
jgi:ureidoglycolate hydrolase